MRARWALGVAAVTLAACGGGDAPSPEPAPWSDAWINREAARFAGDVAARRAALEASLTNPANTYSQMRLELYGHGTRGWDALPVWNPRSVPVDAALADQLARGELPDLAGRAPVWDGVTPTTRAGWEALGERAFFTYPMRADPFVAWAFTDRAAADRLGLERAADGSVPGVVVFADVDGATRVGITCAICHTSVRDGRLVIGAARRRFDYGALRLAGGDRPEPELAQRMATWGPGRADVTEDTDEDPVAIPDLFGLRTQTYLTQAGTLRHAHPSALAIRQDTQLTHANKERIRPPRELAWALAMYLYSLAPPPPAPSTAPPATLAHGAQLFAATCARCHASAARGGGLYAAATIGTDPALATGMARGTGKYRVAPLVDVVHAAPYFHDGSVPTLAGVLDPARTTPGHRFGTHLAAADRAALLAFLATL